jgi:ubiquinone/menaquinone biosynthesis C-methylase UbiE
MNIPDDEDIVSQTVSTYDKIAPAYCRKTRLAKYLDWEEKYIRKMIGLIGTSGPAILDVGCGDGRHCRLIEKNGGKATGIDLSQAMINEAASYYPDGRFYLMDMRALEFDDDTFDGIWSSGSIYHVRKAEVDRVPSEYRRVLKGGGVLSLNFKLGEGEGLEANPRSYGGAPRYFAYYSHDEMLALLTKHGFVELESCLYPEEIFGDNILQMWLRINK